MRAPAPGKPIEERRARLQKLLAKTAAGSCIAFSEEHAGDGAEFFRAADKLGLEGIVSKRLGSIYVSGNSRAWLKTKAMTTGTFDVIGVDRTPKGAPIALLATFEKTGRRYVGDAFVTLPAKLRAPFWSYIEQHAADTSPIAGLRRKSAVMVRPGLTATGSTLERCRQQELAPCHPHRNPHR